MSGRKYYCYCDSNCKFETMTKEQILAAIEQAARWDTGVRMVDSDTDKRYALYVSDGKLMMRESDGSEQGSGLDFDADAAFITKVKETNAGGFITFWVGTQAQYHAIANKDPNCYYHITDSTRDADIFDFISENYDIANDALGVAYAVKATADSAVSTANKAVSTANNALSVANSKTNGMVQGVDSGLLQTLEYTAVANAAKFYIVTIGKKVSNTLSSGTTYSQYSGTVIFDYKGIDILGLGGTSCFTQINEKSVIVTATKLVDGRVRFGMAENEHGLSILHVAGYY